MGVFIQLNVLGQYIPDQEWREIFDEALYLLRSENTVRPASETVQVNDQMKVNRTFFSRNIEKHKENPSKHHWHVVGDIDSLLTAESFVMYRDRDQFEPYREPSCDADIITEMVDAVENRHFGNYYVVFNSKTQGYPYHYSMLAVGMLVEDRFPRYAVVSGDIDRYQAIKSQQLIKEVLAKEVALPVVTEYERLIDRIKKSHNHVGGIEAFFDIVRDDPRRDAKESYEAIAKKFSKSDFHCWILNQLKRYRSPSQRGSLRIFIGWLNAGFDLKTLVKIACLEENGPQFQPDLLAEALVKSLWLTVELRKRDELMMLQTPKGETNQVMSQLADSILDMMGGIGRELHVYLPEDQLLAVFKDLFPDRIDQLRDIVTNAQKELAVPLTQANESLKDLARKTETETAGFSLTDGSEFLTLAEEDALSKDQEQFLRAIASMINTIEDQIRGEEKLGQQLAMFTSKPDMDTCRYFLIETTGKYGPRLTEDAWNWIDQETDFSLIKTLCLLSIIDQHEQRFSYTKKSIFEKRWLCQLVTDWSKDENEMARA